MSEEKKSRAQTSRTETTSKEQDVKTKKKKTSTDSEPYREEPNKTSSRKSRGNKQEELPPSESPKKEPNPSSVGNQLMMALLIVMSVFIGICFAFRDDVGVIGYAIHQVLFGLFGLAAFLVPFLLLQMALYWRRDVVSGSVKYKYLVAIFVMLFSSVMVQTIYCMVADIPKSEIQSAYSWDRLKGFFESGVSYRGGGFFGGLIACALICAVGYPGTILFDFLFWLGFVMALFGLTPMECIQRYRFYRGRSKSAQKVCAEERKEKREEREKRAREAAERAENDENASRSAKKKHETSSRRKDNIDKEIFEDDATFGSESEQEPSKECEKKTCEKAVKEEKLRPVGVLREEKEEKVTLVDIFDEEKDETLRSRYADTPFTEEDDVVAEVDLQTSADTSCKNQTAIDDLQYLVSVKKTKSEPKTAPRSAVTAEKNPAYGPIRKTETVKKQEDAEANSNVIAIRPPEMSMPAPDTVGEEETPETPKPREYEFPPIDLLSKPPKTGAGGDVSAELRENADRIIQTLDSFNVRVNISNVSRGPTITRYEVEPAPGTRVRSIINLLDDIALSLATSGVRSDGIISGKSAIGIEVPNKKTATVFVRELIEDSRFESAKSKLTTSLGMDVSGAPVYLDIAKMPHLLIAGATGQGKSVCINSLIISLLYKARPDEVKLILIDPKKVELNVYNGLPHLLVPVVFEPKKAAGSLHWAVQEMERRFELIESRHVRNIAQYNAAVADDPIKEKLPQVVIIIDELADLMMSAPDDVETSICRLAQKARAAGIHLIIGTQRPSTDVITGLIKANIPSRIAFTVSNQIDSRIIIDTQGAEKLIGKGDMLFAPVGSSKPIRVQGSFVSETEIESIVDFIKAQGNEITYSDEIIKEIEKNAAVCGQKKGKATASGDSDAACLAEGEEVDPMLDAAIELAVESGKISTSLIQRRLSLGYGRAAKLIDVMEKRGIVSPPEGQKPRSVLISREQYLEMHMNDSDSNENGNDDVPFDV